ncbi:cystatin-1 [Tetranychus urticae]|uniref:cystatin-1 n=1 Tax=Tetranychus urticae TaxID=32264 RepID=UPI00077B8AE3|nr:cystatin-1 [Tetranychus urticae]
MKLAIILTACLFGTVFAQEGLPGGWNSLSTDDSTVNQLAIKSVNHHNSVNNSAYYKKLVKIQEARYQVVAGFKYEIKFLIGKTECAKTGNYTDSCQVAVNSPTELCTYVFWMPPVDKDRITSFDCVATK